MSAAGAAQAAAGPRAVTAELETALAGILGEPVAIAERHPAAYRSTFPLEELTIRCRDSVERVVFKDLSPGAPADRLRAPFLRDPQREIAIYRDLVAPNGLTAPAFRGAAIDPGAGRYWLFLESVDGVPLWQSGDPEVWAAAARWLAALHGRYAPGRPPESASLLRLDTAHHRRWLRRALRFAADTGGAAHGRGELARLAIACRRAARRLARWPATLLHGEFYPSNVLVERDAGGYPRIRPVDWEMAAVGPAPLDLAALASGAWSGAERRALVAAYRAALAPTARPPLAALAEAVDEARLVLAVQWLGWARSWPVPPHQTHDWWTTALRLAEELEGARPDGLPSLEDAP